MVELDLGPGAEPIEAAPVVLMSQVFPARPFSIPDIRIFVRHCLAESPRTEEGTSVVGEPAFRALMDAAGATGSIDVAFRIFPERVEVDVLHSDSQLARPVQPVQPGSAAQGSPTAAARQPDASTQAAAVTSAGPVSLAGPGQSATFAEWMASALRSRNLTQEAAARQLGVSAKTISRWVGGTTEPRLRDLRRIQEVFGAFPLDVG